MNNRHKIILFICIFTLFTLSSSAIAQSYVQDQYENIDYYELGMSSIKNREYTKAIDYLKKALAKEPNNTSIRNNLAVALTSRGTYYYNQGIDLEKAANDYRSAIYYLQYFGKYDNSDTITQNINIAHQNLNSVLTAQKAQTDSLSRLKKAKELRGKGELTASVIEYISAAKDRQYSYESYVALGDVMKAISNEYNAALYYDKALAVKSTEPDLHLKFGRTLYNLGNIDAAVRELDIASENPKTKNDSLSLLEVIWKNKVSQNPKDPVAQMNLGAVYQNKGNYAQAMNQYKTAQSIDPKNQMIRLNMATLLQEQGSYSEALEIYNSILKNRPNDVLVNTYKASTLDKMGKKDEAIVIYQNLLAANPGNKNIKTSLLETISTAPDISALAYLSKLSQNMPNDAEIQYNYAFMLHKNRKYDEAISYYEKSIQLNSKNLDAYLNLASLYKQKGNITMAIDTLNKAKNIFPNNTKISQTISEYNDDQAFSLIEKATKLYDEKRYNEAISVYKSIQNPSEDVYLGIGASYQAMERYDDAITYYNKAISMDSSNPNSYYFLGLAYYYKKDYIKADNALKKALQLDSLNPDIIDAYKSLKFARSEEEMNKGIALFDSKKFPEAIQKFNSAINMCPENGYAYYYRGITYDTQSQTSKAIADYQKAISLTPDLTMAYYSMALSYEAAGNKVEAKNMYRKFLNTNQTDDEYTKYAKQRLSEL